MSRLSQATQAVRPSLKGRILMSGPQGSGKTRGALIIASVLAGPDGKVLFIDTEKESGLTYADDFSFLHLPWRPPFHPGELGDLLLEAGKNFAVIIVDSVSHFWQKEGGTLDIAGGKFTGWKDARPVQEQFIEGVLGTGAHVVLCARAKVEHTQETDSRGKQIVRKLGMGIKQDDELEYEVNVALELGMDHAATVTKSRTTVLPVLEVWPGHRWGELAERYKGWLAGGEPPAEAAAVQGLIEQLNKLPEDVRKAAKADWVAKLGRPEALRQSQFTAAEQLVAEWTAPAPTSSAALAPVTGEGDGQGAAGETQSQPSAEPEPTSTTTRRPSPLKAQQGIAASRASLNQRSEEPASKTAQEMLEHAQAVLADDELPF